VLLHAVALAALQSAPGAPPPAIPGASPPIHWEPLTPQRASAASGATASILADGSVLLGGALPDKETITLECALERKGVTGFRLEALPDGSLPAKGPGCANNGNFVLTEFKVAAAPKGSSGLKPVFLERPTAGFEQAQFPIVGTLDGASHTGWAISPAVGLAHEAIFESRGDVGFDVGTKLQVTLEMQYGGRHLLGRFRVSTTTSPRPLRVERDASGVIEAQGKVGPAIARGLGWLLEQQELDGSWAAAQPDYHHGMTALACYTLIKAGLKKNHPAILRALDFMATRPPAKTYEAGLELLARAAMEDESELPRMQEIADRLLSWQGGGWSYPERQPDLSNTQYAALGLRAAAQHGVKIPADAWTRLGDEVLTHQEKASGAYDPAGFGYYAGGSAFGSITAGGVGVLQICHEQLEKLGVPRAAYAAAARRGVAWLDRNFSPHANPKGDGAWIWYWLYGIERVGGLCGVNELGGVSWYREGAKHAVEQQKPDGSWDGGGGPQPSTCFALLFLARATSSVSGVAQKADAAHGADDPKVDVNVRAFGDTPLTTWISSFGERVKTELEWPQDEGRGPRVARVEYVLPGRALLPCALDDAGAWRVAFEPPPAGWEQPSFDDRKWKSAPGAFGLPESRGAAVRTEWRSDEIWLRREFQLDDVPLVAPVLRVHFSGREAPAADAARPALLCLFDEEPGFAGLVNEASGGSTIRVQEKDAFQGRSCLAVTPQQAFRAAMPGWGFGISEKPRPGEYRYLRFAWRKEGGGGIMLQIAQDGGWGGSTRRVVAGPNEVKWAATEISKSAPQRWTVVTVDLWKEFGGAGMLTGLAFTPMSGDAGYWDAIQLARSLEDFKAPTKNASASAPASEDAASAPRAAAVGEGPALEIHLNGTPIYATSEAHDAGDELAAVTPLAPLEVVLQPGRNVLAVRARRIGAGQSLDVAIEDEKLLASVPGDASVPCGTERFAAQVSFERAGRFPLRARVHVRPPPKEGDAGGADAASASGDVLLESAPLTIPIRDALDAELLAYAKDPGRNLIATAGASATATSAFDSNWLPQRTIDGYAGRGWLSSDADPRPTLTIELQRPVRADTVLVTPIQMRGADPERANFRVRRVEVLVDQGRGGSFELPMPEDFRKGIVRLPKVLVVRRLDLRILDVTGATVGKPAAGLGEVELELRK
jgi:hypothetical protein